MCGPTAVLNNSVSGSQSHRRPSKHSQSLVSNSSKSAFKSDTSSSCTLMELDSTDSRRMESAFTRFGGWASSVKVEAMPQEEEEPYLVLSSRGGKSADSDTRSCVNSHSLGACLTQDFVGDKFGGRGGGSADVASSLERAESMSGSERQVQHGLTASLLDSTAGNGSECGGPASLYASRSSSESFPQQPLLGDSSLLSTSNSSANSISHDVLGPASSGILVPQRSKQSLAAWAMLMHKVQKLHDSAVADRGGLDAREPRFCSSGPREKAITLGGEKSAFNSVRSCSKMRSSQDAPATTRSSLSSGEFLDSDDRQSGGGNPQHQTRLDVPDQACSVVGSPEHHTSYPGYAFPPKKRPFLATMAGAPGCEEAQALEIKREKNSSSEELRDEGGEEGAGHSLLSLGPPSESRAQDYIRKPSKIPRVDSSLRGGKSASIFVDLNVKSDEVVLANDRVASDIGREQHPDSASAAAREDDAESNPGWTSERGDEAGLGLSLASDRSPPLCHTPCTSIDADHKDAVEAASEIQAEGVTSPTSVGEEEEEEDLPAGRAWNFLSSTDFATSRASNSASGLEENQDRPLFWESRYANGSGPGRATSNLVGSERQTQRSSEHVSSWRQQKTHSLFRVGAQQAQPVQDQASLRNSTAVRLSIQSTAALFENPPAGMEAQGLSLVHLLLQCAEAAAKDDSTLAAEILGQLYQGASLYGDSMQRIAAYFAEGLAARVVGKTSPVYSTLMHEPSVGEALFAFTALYKVSPYFQFAHFTANQMILEAMEGQDLVHVVDLDIMQGFQWPSLIQSLALRAGGPPQLLRITGIGEAGILRETQQRLESFASSFDIAFEFNSVAKELEHITPDCIGSRPGEAIAVNAVFQLHTLLHHPDDHTDQQFRLQKFLRSVSKLGPDVVTLVEQEANHNAPTFVSRFVEALHYYAAIFDSLDASLPQQSEDRVKIEQVHFGTQIKNIVACEGAERVQRHETAELWQQRMKAAGFVQLPLSSHNVTQAKLLLQLCPCEGYKLSERAGCVSLGWQDRQLLSASAWACQRSL